MKPLVQRLTAFTLVATTLLTALTACAAPEPTPTPDIPATVAAQVQAYLTAIPTATPLPTHTPYPTATDYPTSTPRPTYTPYPTPTPPPNWKVFQPSSEYSIELPADWYTVHYEPRDENTEIVSYKPPGQATYVIIFSFYLDDEAALAAALAGYSLYDVFNFADLETNPFRDMPGFQILSLDFDFPHVTRSHYRFSANWCDIEGFSLEILLPKQFHAVYITTCQAWRDVYDDAFIGRVFSSFKYDTR